MNRILLQDKRVIIVIHESIVGPGHDLRDFLLREGASEVLFIAHPLLYLKEYFKNSSRLELYKDGMLYKKSTAYHWRGFELFLYLKDAFYTLYWCIKYSRNYDIFIGLDNLNACCGIVLQKLGLVRKTIFYAIDYVPQRFENRLVNRVYHEFEKRAAWYCDWTWNLSPRMIEAREKRWNVHFSHQLVVPHGIHFDRIQRVPFNKVQKNEIIFMGALLKKQGVQLAIRSLVMIKKIIPDIRLTIIGKGPYETQLKRLSARFHVEENVVFLGHITSPNEMENRIARASIAIALYEPKSDDFSYYTDPGKVKNYLGAGVPILLTDVPIIARDIVEAKCGLIVKYSEDSFIKTLIQFLHDEHLMKEYRQNAVRFAKKYTWELVFTKALRPAL